ncbi:GNAT family N-acetyltransferase [Streptosporangium sandarakinum]
MGKSKRIRAQRKLESPLNERSLVGGWAATPQLRIRQATTADMDRVGEFARMVGVEIESQLSDSVAKGFAGAALRICLRNGREAFKEHMAKEFFDNQEDPITAYLNCALILVAEHRDHGIVGALMAYPPVSVVQMYIQSMRTSDSKKIMNAVICGALGVSRIKALAVTESARRAGIGSALLKYCTRIYSHCGYHLLYGKMSSATPGLDLFYQRHGFDVLPPETPLNLRVIFGNNALVGPGPDEQFFVRLT